MTRFIHIGNYGVYVHDERGAPHHHPHCHVKFRGQRIATVHLLTLELLLELERVPADVMAAIKANQDAILREWEMLNDA